MFELVKALNDGAETLKNQTSNSISLNAGCELFIAFVTLFPHDSAVCHFLHILYHTFISFCQNFTDLKKELIRHGQTYATEALTYRKKIAELAFGFIKDGSVVSSVHHLISVFFCSINFTRYHIDQILTHSYSRVVMQTLLLAHKRKRISGITLPFWWKYIYILFKFLSQKHALADWGM
jgi:translation initiation factor eIF-2B subunit alpha